MSDYFNLLNLLTPIILLAILAFYVAGNLGANDVANSMGTSVGSKALTLRQALMVAGILEFTGAVLFGHGVSTTLATEVVNPKFFASQPQVLLVGMVSVMIACGLWLQIATSWGLPVASSHAVVGALAGFSWVAVGSQAVDWQTIGLISLTWLVTPMLSGAIAAGFYRVIQGSILDDVAPMQKLQEWIPWLSAALFGIFGAIALPRITAPINHWMGDRFGLMLPPQDLPLVFGTVAAVTLTVIIWRSADLSQLSQNIQSDSPLTDGVCPPYPPNLGGVKEVSVSIVSIQNVEAKSESPLHFNHNSQNHANYARSLVEKQLAKFQVISACFVAFAHGSNDVGNAIAPLAAISYILRTGSVPGVDFSVPLWILILGGAGIVTGLGLWGKNVISTVGEKIISLQPSAGFCAELATATTVLMASRLGFPVSTSHALVGGVVGIGLVRNVQNVQNSKSRLSPYNPQSIRWQTVRSIILAWLITVPVAGALSALIFNLLFLTCS
jgi:PiT family inorganic phosphate transporter